tara:strand:- start:7166 stop:7480 length:315 start_codon:yes stop_codon:yes gene_type:complete
VEAHSVDKKPVIVEPDYTLYLDEFEGLQFIHCDVRKWNKATKKRLHEALELLHNIYKEPFYAAHDIDDNKHRKFLEMYGFKYFSTEHCLDGLLRQVWIKEMNNG